jgi:hypothetical protein
MYLVLSIRDANIPSAYLVVRDCKGRVYNPEDRVRDCEECKGGAPPNGRHKSAAEDLPDSH